MKLFTRLLGLLLGILLGILFFSSQGHAQITTGKENIKEQMHHEIPDDSYKPNNFKHKKTSPAFTYRDGVFFTTQVNVNELGQNILGDAANEPSITIDPTDPARIAIGWRQFDDVNNNFRQAGYGYTSDFGETWTFPGVIDPGVFRSDPVLDCDSEGNFYYNSLTFNTSGDYICDVFKIEAGGYTWDEGTFAQGGDKQWMVIDKTGGQGDGNIYSFWTQSWSVCYPGHFTRSVDGNTSYEDCEEVDGEPSWGTMAVGPEGELYIVGDGSWLGLVVARSSTASNPDMPVDWDFYSTVDLDGYLAIWPEVNPAGLLGQAYIDVDKSGGPGNGYVYVLASVERNSNSDPGDVMLARSTDGGVTWEEPIRINDDSGTSNYQWFGTLSVAPNGRIDVVWLDTRDALPGSYMSSLYYCFSLDQGDTWSENIRLSASFDPHVGWPNQDKMGDYFHMVSDDESAHLAWAGTFNEEQDVYYGRITPLATVIADANLSGNTFSLSCYPNPSNGQTTIRYMLPDNYDVGLTLIDLYGKDIRVLLNAHQQAGSQKIVIHTGDLNGGVYFCRLQAGSQTETTRIVVLK
nr:T9SS type A sorting domain-containing protein [Bacteroidota bacterium]